MAAIHPTASRSNSVEDAQAVSLPVGLVATATVVLCVVTGCHGCSYQGYIGAYLVLGGIDSTGPSLFTVHAHGSTDKLPYVSMGKWWEVGVASG